MRDECIASLKSAAQKMGKTLTSTDFQDIESRILQAARDNARDNREAQIALSPGERMKAAAERAANDLIQEKTRKTANIARQIIATTRNEHFVNAMAEKGVSRFKALRQLAATHQDAQGNAASIEQHRFGIMSDAMRNMTPVVDATSKYAGFWADRAGVRDVLRELYGEKTGNNVAEKAARAWENSAESLRVQFNELGGNVRKRKDWAVPQHHSQLKVAEAGKAAWVKDIFAKLDREEYVNHDGKLMTDAQLHDMLEHAWDTIATDGANKIDAGAVGGKGGIKNRGDERRVLHFKDADSYLDYQQKYGEKSLLETMVSHIDSQARNIAALKVFGPNAESAFKYLLDKAYQDEMSANPKKAAKIQKERLLTQATYDQATGKMGVVADPKLAHAFSTARTAMVLSKLGSATLSAITDGANMSMVARVWGIPQWKRYMYELKAVGSKNFRDVIRSNGVGVEAITHAVSRFGEETFGHGATSTLANTLLRVSGLNWVDNVRRVGSGAMLMDKLGELSRKYKSLDQMHPNDQRVLLSRGINPDHYAVWRKAELSDGLLTPLAIANIPDEAISSIGDPAKLRRDAMQSLMAVVAADVNTIVPMMTDKAAAATKFRLGGVQRGTIGGEIINSVLQFKSFPLAMISNHWQRIQSMPTVAGKVLYGAELVATSTLLGAMVVQMKGLANGQNPQDMSDPKFMARATIVGGALGLYGDLVLNPVVNIHRTEDLAQQLGPLFSVTNDLFKVAQTAYRATDETKRTDLPGEAVRFIRGNTPFASLWYTKAVVDHLIFQALQDYFSPGYSERTEQRMQQEYGNTSFWPKASGETLGTLQSFNDLQKPDLSTALGNSQ